MGAKRDIHAVPREDGWAVRREGASRTHRTMKRSLMLWMLDGLLHAGTVWNL